MKLLTVVIVTCNRQAMLRELLASLENQAWIEPAVIVSDDSQYEGYHRVARYNEGVKMAETPYVVLLDDDCLPVGDRWAIAHIDGLYNSDVVRGMFKENDMLALTPWFSSNNVSMKTEIAKELGPFDMAYDGKYGYEDIDLELGLKKIGASITIGSPETAILHRGVPDHSYHTGLEENMAYYRKKWNIP